MKIINNIFNNTVLEYDNNKLNVKTRTSKIVKEYINTNTEINSDNTYLYSPESILGNYIPIIYSKDINDYEKEIMGIEKIEEIHIIVDSTISWGLLEYLFNNKVKYLRLTIDENSLIYLNQAFDSNIESIYKFNNILGRTNLELIINLHNYLDSNIENIGINFDIDSIINKYLEKDNTKVINNSNKFKRIIKSMNNFTPNIILVEDSGYISKFNTVNEFDKLKPLVILNKGCEDLILLEEMNSFRDYKEEFRKRR